MATLFAACSLLFLNAAQAYAPCGGSLSGSKGGFNSPNYPDDYPNNADCLWYIQTPGENKVIKLYFPFISLEGRYPCDFDAISIYDGSSTEGRLLGKLCGEQSSSFHFTGENMTVRFQSDKSNTYPGFRAEYQLVETTAGPVENRTDKAPCGGSLSGSRGRFNSPNYPDNYPDNVECLWYIQTPGGNQVIKLDFPFISLEVDSHCIYDAVSVYDGSSTEGRLLGKLCGEQSSSFHSTGANMTVRFQSDGSNNYPGFQAEYQLVAEGSCRYNCGQQVGNCSCSDLCQYNGNCCQDYQNHCSGVTPQPETSPDRETTAGPMDNITDRDGVLRAEE